MCLCVCVVCGCVFVCVCVGGGGGGVSERERVNIRKPRGSGGMLSPKICEICIRNFEKSRFCNCFDFWNGYVRKEYQMYEPSCPKLGGKGG